MTTTPNTLLAGFEWHGDIDPAYEFSGDLRIDSRKVVPGDIFVACRGAVGGHGAAYVEQAAANGASAILVSDDLSLESAAAVPTGIVESLDDRLYELAERYYRPDWNAVAIIAVTGTNGKTSVVRILHSAASSLGVNGASIGTIGYDGPGYCEAARETTPHFVDILRLIAVWQAESPSLLVGIEASSHGLSQKRFGGLPVDVAAITNISRDHMDYHRTFEDYRDAKASLFCLSAGAAANVAVVPDKQRAMVADSGTTRTVVYWGDAKAVDCRQLDVTSAGAEYELRIESSIFRFLSKLIGDFQAENSAVAAAALHVLGYSGPEIVAALEQVDAVPGRMQVVSREPVIAVVDYAHTPDALERALAQCRKLVGRGHLVCVFGCGGDRDRGKRVEMGQVARRVADTVIITSDNPRSENPQQIADDIIGNGALGESLVVELDRSQAIKRAVKLANDGDLVLVAGKGHEQQQIFVDRTVEFDDVEVLKQWALS